MNRRHRTATSRRPSRTLAMLLLAGCIAALAQPAARAGDTAAEASLPPAPAAASWSTDQTAVIEAVTAYHRALTGGDVAAVEAHVVPTDEFVMLEGKHSNWGWADYRDHHLAGELDNLSKVRFRLTFYRVAADQKLGYAAFRFEVLPKNGPEMDFGSGLATAVLQRTSDGWKLRHLQTP